MEQNGYSQGNTLFNGREFFGQRFQRYSGKAKSGNQSVLEIIPEETIYMVACKSAIKANRSMSPMEIKGLLNDLVNTENPYTCIHGRPIIISISKKN